MRASIQWLRFLYSEYLQRGPWSFPSPPREAESDAMWKAGDGLSQRQPLSHVLRWQPSKKQLNHSDACVQVSEVTTSLTVGYTAMPNKCDHTHTHTTYMETGKTVFSPLFPFISTLIFDCYWRSGKQKERRARWPTHTALLRILIYPSYRALTSSFHRRGCWYPERWSNFPEGPTAFWQWGQDFELKSFIISYWPLIHSWPRSHKENTWINTYQKHHNYRYHF